jgi:SAM-dependent methyltransferase
MSLFTAVDSAPDPRALVTYLDQTTQGQWAMKNYVAATFGRYAAGRLVLDVGCGTGSDLALLDAVGVTAVGIDNSQVMIDTARERGSTRVCLGVGERLPFRDASFSGCRIERVLMHVEDPAVVLREIARCLRRGAVLTVSEPDWSAFVVRDADGAFVNASWLNSARHPDMGARLWELAEAAGCEVLDQVEELSVWRSLARLDGIVGGASAALVRAVESGRVSAAYAQEWLRTQEERDARGAFDARMRKVLLVARKR